MSKILEQAELLVSQGASEKDVEELINLVGAMATDIAVKKTMEQVVEQINQSAKEGMIEHEANLKQD